ncbi:DUF29 domain-containing protein [Limnothrix sp. FACHB-708]|uniref:DUF29 domain-containing protein n=1 Tax=unclassified Limnothrix TaxID=2632864 RepID=UPI001681F261|nr:MULTISPECIES: DUF29 domain-containing protein [unclassified Limnothrix]MBD2552113.1 DUF29 domain-containing protein [Limnothrix sp. FACHB-708]MBD2589793.1 DUF29 domain-containing protein [Limnothrix sp. FACHB-406]
MNTTYDRDFYAWTQEQIALLQNRDFGAIDLPNLIEEIAVLGRQEREQLINRLGVLIGHLLKWCYQPERRKNSWIGTIREQRRRIQRLLKNNPSLQPFLDEAFREAYLDGRDLAIQETNLADSVFPETAPFTLEFILSDELEFSP